MQLQVIEIRQGKKVFRALINPMGNYTILGEENKLAKMIAPVSCNHCGKSYDLCDVKVNHRYADCTQYKTPCCDKLADDREWKSLPDFTRIPNK